MRILALTPLVALMNAPAGLQAQPDEEHVEELGSTEAPGATRCAPGIESRQLDGRSVEGVEVDVGYAGRSG